MKGKINGDWYCTNMSNHYRKIENESYCTEWAENQLDKVCYEKCRGCLNCHRKYPTPEQFEEEYGEKWNGAKYYLLTNDDIFLWSEKLTIIDGVICEPVEDDVSVCASTPWGKPPADWRPE